MELPNKARAANPAIALLFHAGRHRRGVADARRYERPLPLSFAIAPQV
jgi:hypothetical protein